MFPALFALAVIVLSVLVSLVSALWSRAAYLWAHRPSANSDSPADPRP